MDNKRIAEQLDEIADLLELQDRNAFKVRAYRNASRSVRNLSRSVEDILDGDETLGDVPNIGESIENDITEMVDSGVCERLKDLREEVPSELTELLRVPGLGPRTAMQIHEELDVDDLDGLEKACENEAVRELDGLGAKTEENIARGIETVRGKEGRILLHEAEESVENLRDALDDLDGITDYEVAGSYRRCRETVGDLDILLRVRDRKQTNRDIAELEIVNEVINQGNERMSVRLENGLRVDFRYFDAGAFGSALLYFTGSKAHNIALRKIARENDWKLNEYGLMNGDNRLAGKTEESVYRRLNLAWVPPELREDRGEIEAAAEDEIPRLIEAHHIHGDLHVHTDKTDGNASLKEMAEAAIDCGYQYLAITEHSKRVHVANGLNADQLRRHADNIRKLDDDLDDLWLMTGVEVDILKSGKLDLPDKLLNELDYVVASAHYNRNMSRDDMTERLVTAIESGVIHALGHPLGRIIGKREPMEFDTDRVFAACVDNQVALEIDAQPDRLDLPDRYCREARDAGVHFSVVTDAHSVDGLELMHLGIDVARRGWLRRKDVLNTRTAKQMRKYLTKGGAS